MVWNPNQYLKFGSARLRPALDLVNRAVGLTMGGDASQVKSILDLGCGTGNISEILCRAFPNAQVECYFDNATFSIPNYMRLQLSG